MKFQNAFVDVATQKCTFEMFSVILNMLERKSYEKRHHATLNLHSVIYSLMSTNIFPAHRTPEINFHCTCAMHTINHAVLCCDHQRRDAVVEFFVVGTIKHRLMVIEANNS